MRLRPWLPLTGLLSASHQDKERELEIQRRLEEERQRRMIDLEAQVRSYTLSSSYISFANLHIGVMEGTFSDGPGLHGIMPMPSADSNTPRGRCPAVPPLPTRFEF